MRYFQLVKYISSGFFSISSYYFSLFLLYDFMRLNYKFSIALSLLVGAFLNFYLNKRYTFEISGRFAESIIKYSIAFIFNYFLQIIIIVALFERYDLNLYFSSVIALAITSVVGFICFKKFVFVSKGGV